MVAHGGCCRDCSAGVGTFFAGVLEVLERGSLEPVTLDGAGLDDDGLLGGDWRGAAAGGRGRVAVLYGDGATGDGTP